MSLPFLGWIHVSGDGEMLDVAAAFSMHNDAGADNEVVANSVAQ